jgi:HPt (histidine-containing phosphotransfer) domain-containing protein
MADENFETGEAAGPARIFSWPRLRENFMGNEELVRSLLRRFIERTEGQITSIPGLAERGDWDTAVRETHTIKGSAWNLSAQDLGDAAMRWEESCKSRDPVELTARGRDCAEAFTRFKALVEPYLADGESPRTGP